MWGKEVFMSPFTVVTVRAIENETLKSLESLCSYTTLTVSQKCFLISDMFDTRVHTKTLRHPYRHPPPENDHQPGPGGVGGGRG